MRTARRLFRLPFFLFIFRLSAGLGAVPFLVNTLDILLHPLAPSISGQEPVQRVLFGLLVAPLTLGMAVLCIRRAPANLIGWLLVSFSYGIPVDSMRAGLLPLEVQVLIANLLIGQYWFAFLLIPLYFPDGELFPPGARRWGSHMLGSIFIFTLVISNICNPRINWGSGSSQVSVANPLFVFEWDYRVATIPLMLLLINAGILAVILRYRGSREQERLQLRWLLFGVLFQGGLTVLTLWAPPGLEPVAAWFTSFYSLIIPGAVGIALLRYRLYDIDLIIRRTVQYGLLTFLLGLVYFGGVALLQQVFVSTFGEQSPLAVVLSTLLIATLFTPARRRVQAFIDRRFYRRRYNAGQVLQHFVEQTRTQADLGQISGQLLATVQDAFEPQQISLWLPGISPAVTLKKEEHEHS